MWGEQDIKELDLLSKKIDINKKLFVNYSRSWKKIPNTPLIEDDWLEILVNLLFKAALLDQQTVNLKLKRFNVLFKALDMYTPKWLAKDSELANILEQEWLKLIKSLPLNSDNTNITYYNARPALPKEKEIKEIPITLLFYEGPIARAYLSTLKSLGLKPQKIIELIASDDLVSKKPIGKWLPKKIRKAYATTIHRNKIHYWPKYLAKSESQLVAKVFSEIQSSLNLTKKTIEEAHNLLPLKSYCDNVSSILIKNLNDPNLKNYLLDRQKGIILYTGGGIVPAKLLSTKELDFLSCASWVFT